MSHDCHPTTRYAAPRNTSTAGLWVKCRLVAATAGLLVSGCGGGNGAAGGATPNAVPGSMQTVLAAANAAATSDGQIKGYVSKCLDIQGNNQISGTPVQLFDCQDGAGQKWSLDDSTGQLRSTTGLCLGVLGALTDDGANVVLWQCDGSANQRWRFDGALLRSEQSNKCLDVYGLRSDNGARVTLWSCNGGDNQKWALTATAHQPAPVFQATTIIYGADDSFFANPETGAFYEFLNTGTNVFLPPVADIRSTLKKEQQTKGVSMVFLTYYLGDYKYQDLPQSILARIDADLATLRELGLKADPHFHYAYDYDYEKPQDWREPERDAAKDVIVRHAAQLKPVLAKNADVIALISWGMIGPWGEQWISSSGNVGDANSVDSVNNNTRAIFRAMLDATPPDRMVTFLPRGKRQLYGDVPTSAAEAFTGTDKSRVGIENQCFLTDSLEGNYSNNDGRGPTSYLAVDGLYVPQVAFPDVGCGSRPTADQFIAELDRGHWDHVNYAISNVLNKTDTDPEVVRVMKSIGYRFSMRNATVQNTVQAGQPFKMTISMANLNGGTLYNPRKIEVIFRHKTTGAKFVQNIVGDSVGNRLYFPSAHETKTWTLGFTPPASLPAGQYDVLLNLPDPYPSLYARPEYSIRLANHDVWEAATGYNGLRHTLTVTAPAGLSATAAARLKPTGLHESRGGSKLRAASA